MKDRSNLVLVRIAKQRDIKHVLRAPLKMVSTSEDEPKGFIGTYGILGAVLMRFHGGVMVTGEELG